MISVVNASRKGLGSCILGDRCFECLLGLVVSERLTLEDRRRTGVYIVALFALGVEYDVRGVT